MMLTGVSGCSQWAPVRIPLIVLPLLLAAGCTAGKDASREPSHDQRAASDIEWFTDRAHDTGLDFVHFNGMSGKFYQPEIMGPGVALFDYDNDGDLDVFVVQGEMLGNGKPLLPLPSGAPRGGRLYRNDLEIKPDGARTLHFTDVTEQSGIKTIGYGMGAAVGDFDNDGWPDLYVTGFGRSQLFHNNGNGTFTDVTERSGTGNLGSWGVSAAFVDFDRDGWLDLFVGNYLNSSLQNYVACTGVTGHPDYCRPSAYGAQPSRLYRNVGGGKFVDVTIASGLAGQYGPALGVSTADFNGDGWIDIFVANDEHENQLWINQHDGTFKNTALQAGVALGSSGQRNANMGVDAGDFDGDGDEDLVITELVGQGSTLYVNDGSGSFEEQSVRTGLRAASLPYSGFGVGWLDFDNDGWLDILSVNGDVIRNTASSHKNDPFPLGQRNQLLRNIGGRFEDVTSRAGRVFDLIEVSRGAAFGDIDNDGDTDVVVANDAGPIRLLINNVGNRNHWIGLRLVGEKAHRDMVGARVAVMRSRGPTLWRRARADGSYASANDPRVLVGLGNSSEAPRVRVLWPSGRMEEWTSVAIDRYTTLREGDGK
jgi:hypothetical protein